MEQNFKNLILDDQTLHLLLKNMEMGYRVANIISNLCQEFIVFNHQLKLFKEEAQVLVIAVLKKLFKRTLLTLVVARCSRIFDLVVMLVGPPSTLLNWQVFTCSLDGMQHLVSNKIWWR